MNRVCHSSRVPDVLAARQLRQLRKNPSALDVQDEYDFSGGLSNYSATRSLTRNGQSR
jgi:hypothetical protein